MSFFSELNQRNVIRLAAAYIVVAWLIIQVTETLAPVFNVGNEAVRVVVVALAIGFPIAVILAWVFELTPLGLKLEKDIDRSQPATAQTARKLDRFIIVLLVLALGYFAFDKFVIDPARDATNIEFAAEEARTKALLDSYGDKSIAVLPFVDRSPNGDQSHFSEGISEELINLLANIPDLRVISRSSAFSFKDQSIDITQIAERLNVAHILEGSVRKDGDKIRITTQLIDARTDTYLWSKTYDQTLESIFAVQDEISAEVVSQLKVTLVSNAPRSKKTNSEAHSLYLRARYLDRLGNTDVAPKVEELLIDALDIDPNFISALNALAQVYVGKGTSGSLPVEEARVLVRDLVDRVLAIDPDNGYAHVLSGYPDGAAVGNIPVLIQSLERGLAMDHSNLDSVQVAAEVSYWLGKLDQAIALMDHILARDPLCTPCLYRRALALRGARRFDEAEAAIREYRILDSGGGHTLGTILLLKGDALAALAEFDRLEQPSALPQIKLHGRAIALHDLGRQDEFNGTFKELRDGFGDAELLLVAEVYAWTGNADAAFDSLNKVFDKNPMDLRVLFLNPLFDNLHNDLRWHSFLAKTGTAPEQLAAVKFEVQLPE